MVGSGGGIDRAVEPQVSCKLNNEKEGNETTRVDAFHDAPFRSPTPWDPLMLCPPRSFENPNLGPQPLELKAHDVVLFVPAMKCESCKHIKLVK